MKESGQPDTALSPLKRKLLALMLEKKGVGSRREETITRRQTSGASVLSFAQERVWFFEQLETGTPAHNVPVALRVEGKLDAEALQRSLCEVVRRHEVLRTVFEFADEKPVQVVLPSHDLPARRARAGA